MRTPVDGSSLITVWLGSGVCWKVAKPSRGGCLKTSRSSVCVARRRLPVRMKNGTPDQRQFSISRRRAAYVSVVESGATPSIDSPDSRWSSQAGEWKRFRRDLVRVRTHRHERSRCSWFTCARTALGWPRVRGARRTVRGVVPRPLEAMRCRLGTNPTSMTPMPSDPSVSRPTVERFWAKVEKTHRSRRRPWGS